MSKTRHANNEPTWPVFQVFTSITHPLPIKPEGDNTGAATRRIKSIFVKADFQTLGDYTTSSSFAGEKKSRSFLSVPRSQLSDAREERGGSQSGEGGDRGRSD